MNSIEEMKIQEIHEILYNYYGIDGGQIKRTEEGLQNENYIITVENGMRFVLKKRIKQIYDDTDKVLREKNIAAIIYCISKELPFVVAPRVNAQGTLVSQTEEGVYLLYKFCEGNHEEYDTPEIVGQIGKAISKFHNKSKNYTDRCIIQTDKSFENHILMLKSNQAFYNQYVREIIEEFEDMSGDVNNTTTIIHADLTPSNVIFLNKRLNGIIDFDNIRVSSREEEVIRFLTSISDREDLVEAFLIQYQSVSTDSLNLTEDNIRYFVYKDLIEEIGIWYEKISTRSFAKSIEFYISNLSSTIGRIQRVNEIVNVLLSTVEELYIREEGRSN